MVRVWVVTGCSSGLGKEICLRALARGDKVIATCRGDPDVRLAELIAQGANVLPLDVVAPSEEINAFASKAISIHGQVDVVCNNAGYLQHGALEETSVEETLKQFQTSVFGPLNISRAFLPHMRERKTGMIAMVGSGIAELSVPGCGTYTSAKAAIASLTATMAAEVAPFNVKATCIEPGEYRTEVFAEPTMATKHIPAYEEILIPSLQRVNPNFKQPGDPCKAAERIVDLLTGVGFAKDRKLPMRIPLGDDAYLWKSTKVKNDEEEIKEWREWTCGTNLDSE